ncbi:MAG: rhodanese-like domain-containing protein [Bacteroidales bacterium]|nr:rhodanese-like domain-containing protein [Bacteroidales bacterium]
MNRLILIIVFLLFVSSSFQEQDSPYYTTLDPYLFELQSLTTDSSMLIDVREPFEFYRKRIPNAINIPASDILFTATDTIDKNTSLFLYCSTGVRSSRVALDLYGKGFDNIFILEGGLAFWKKEGYKMEKGKIKVNKKSK